MILAGTPDGVDVVRYGPTNDGDYYLENWDICRASQFQPGFRWLIVQPADGFIFMRVFGKSRWEPIHIKDNS